jgi:hypothetical protein
MHSPDVRPKRGESCKNPLHTRTHSDTPAFDSNPPRVEMPSTSSETEQTPIPPATPTRSQPQSEPVVDTNCRRREDEPAAIEHGPAGDTTAGTASPIPPNSPSTADAVVSGLPAPKPGTKTSTQAKPSPKRKRFVPSKVMTIRCVSLQHFPFSRCVAYSYTGPIGVWPNVTGLVKMNTEQNPNSTSFSSPSLTSSVGYAKPRLSPTY